MTTESMTEDDVSMDMRTVLSAVLSRWLRIVTVTLILVAITYAVLMFVPKLYESQAGILVEPRQNAFTQPAAGQTTTSTTGIAAEAAVSSQIELIKSRDTLLRVIDQLKLRDVAEFNGSGVNPLGAVFQLLGRRTNADNVDETVLANLLDRLTVIRERDSQIISILARSQDPELAAQIANAVAAAHVQRRAELSLQDTTEASVWLEQEIVKLRERVNAAETAVAEFKVANDLMSSGTTNTSLVNQQLSNIATQITNAQERRNTAQSRAALIRSLLESGQPIDGVPDVQASVIIQQLSQAKATLQGELAQREATLLPNHPTVRALRAQIQELQEQISIEARRVVQALEVGAQIESDLVVSLQDELARTKISASDATTSTVQLDELEREAAAQRELLESYLLRYRDAIARSDSNSALPDVRVVTGAAPSVVPASPKTSLILAAVAFVALALQVGGIVFSELMSGRGLAGRRDEIDDEYQPAAADERVVTAVREVTIVDEPLPPMPASAFAEMPPAAATEPLAPEPEPVTAVDPVSVESIIADAPAEEVAPPAAKPAKGKKPRVSKAQAVADAAAAAAPLLAPTYAARTQKPLEISSLSADLALGRSRIVMLAGLTSNKDVVALADRLIADALHNGLSIARVDAGSGETSAEPGLTDLAAELASFGDVVHRGARDGLAEVPWGQQQTLDRESQKPLTLLEALTDIYETVVVMTGPVGRNSALTTFSGADCRMVVVGDDGSDPDRIETALNEATALGYHPVQFITAPAHHAEVA